MADRSPPEPPPLEARVRLSPSVAIRALDDEAIALNLESGMYHGLNETAARMVEVATAADSLADAASELAEEYGQPLEVIERDLRGLCRALLERGLLEASNRRS